MQCVSGVEVPNLTVPSERLIIIISSGGEHVAVHMWQSGSVTTGHASRRAGARAGSRRGGDRVPRGLVVGGTYVSGGRRWPP